MRLSASWMGTLINASHHVDEDQYEPGLPTESQADQHVIDFTMMTVELGCAVALTERFELQLDIPLRLTRTDAAFLDRSGNDLPGFSSIHHRDETIRGVGDVGLSARHRFLRPEEETGWILDGTIGFTLPTGEIEENPFTLGRAGLSHQHIFFGTGTVDPLLGIESRYTSDAFSVRLDLNWRGSVYENVEEFQGPNTFVFRSIGESDFGWESVTVRMGVELLWETAARWSGEIAKNSGRTDLIPLVGLVWAPTDDWASFLILKRPIILDVSGGQMEIPFVLALGTSYSFQAW